MAGQIGSYGTAIPSTGHGTVLGFDFGLRRTGVAVGELALRIAHPLCTIESRSDAERMERITPLVAEWTPVLLVVGLPMHDDGSKHVLDKKVRRFARLLSQQFHLEVKLVDERLSSSEAQSNLRDAGIRGRGQKRVLDQVAAQVILEAFLNSAHVIA
jgi:putative Holliday junction resolvase